MCSFFLFFFFKQKTAYEMRISDWSSDVCSSDLQLLDELNLRSLDDLPSLPEIKDTQQLEAALEKLGSQMHEANAQLPDDGSPDGMSDEALGLGEDEIAGSDFDLELDEEDGGYKQAGEAGEPGVDEKQKETGKA